MKTLKTYSRLLLWKSFHRKSELSVLPHMSYDFSHNSIDFFSDKIYYFNDDEIITQNSDDSDSEFLFQNFIEECVDEQETNDNEIKINMAEEYQVKITEENVHEDENELRSEENYEEDIEIGKGEIIGIWMLLLNRYKTEKKSGSILCGKFIENYINPLVPELEEKMYTKPTEFCVKNHKIYLFWIRGK